jgi:hypothetical protein
VIPPDIDGPKIVMTNPTRAAFVARSASALRIQGIAQDPSGIHAVTVNGLEATPTERGDFAVDIDADVGLNTLEVEAVDEAGNATRLRLTYLYGDFADDPASRQAAEAQALVVELTPPAFDYFATVASDIVRQMPLDNPALGKTTISGDDLPMCNHVNIKGIRYDGANVELALSHDVVRISATLDTHTSSRLAVDFVAVDCTIFNIDIAGRINADQGFVQAELLVDVAMGQYVVDFANITVDLPDYDVDLKNDVGGVLGEIAQWLTEGAIVDAVKDVIDNDAGSMVEEQLAAVVADHELTPINSASQEGVLVVSVDPHDNPGTPETGVSITPEAMVLRLDGHMSAWVLDAEGNYAGELSPVHDGLGPLLSPDRDMGTDGTLEVRASHDVINLALYSLWQWGQLDSSVDLGSIGALLGAELAPFANLRMDLEPHLPPVAVATQGNQRPLEIQIGELDVHVYGTRTAAEKEELLAILTTAMKVPVDVLYWNHTDESGFEIEVGEPWIIMDTREAPLGGEIPKAIERNAVALAPVLVDMVAGDALRFALPTIGSMPLQLAEFGAASANGYLVFKGSFPSSLP